MALKHKILASEFEALSVELKKEYKLNAQMGYDLDLGVGVFITDKDPAGLMSALEHEREETKKAKAAAGRLETEKKEAERAKLTDVEEIKAHFAKELEDRDKKAAAEKKEVERRQLEQQQISADAAKRQRALEVASQLFGTNAPLLLPHIESSLKAIPGETPRVEIIDSSTGLPALDQNLENWKKTLSTNPMFSPMIVVSKASGGSANDRISGIPNGRKVDGTTKTFDDYSAGELMQMRKDTPTEYNRLRSECSRLQNQ